VSLHEQINVWRRLPDNRICCNTCFRVLDTGRYWVQSADFFTQGAPGSVAEQERRAAFYFVDLLSENEERGGTYETLAAAIAAHDAGFENEPDETLKGHS
jgi:hypothetical protein